MSRPLIVVTGKNGQVGWELMRLASSFSAEFDFHFTGREELDLSAPDTIPVFFQKNKPQYFINCAAYTAVDKAETEQEMAYSVNATSVGLIAGQCAETGCTLIQLSTDYVFNGKGTTPYRPDTATDPVNYYGYTKWMGEQLALNNNPRTIIIRTSWVYSENGHNFVKTMLRLMKERPEIKVVSDQVGSPTYAADLASAILTIISSLEQGNRHYGIYHYSNSGEISWFRFAEAIRDLAQLNCTVLPQPSEAYPTPAKRPAYSVLDKTTLTHDFPITLMEWEDALGSCLKRILHQ